MLMKEMLILLVCLFAINLAYANEAAPLADDPVLEQRLIAISDEMRCLVCQNESLSGSRSELAQDLRRQIRELISQGQTDAQIRTYMVDRYGDFILYRPPVKSITLLLWMGPFALMMVGVTSLLIYLRKRSKQITTSALSDEDNKNIDTILRGK